MKKIISLYKRDEITGIVYDEVTPGAEWVMRGEGMAHRKMDGTAVLIEDSLIYKRLTVKNDGSYPDTGFPAQPELDKATGKWPWWIPIVSIDENKPFFEAFTGSELDGTYELCGPKINGNPEKLDRHRLISHKSFLYITFPVSFKALKIKLSQMDIEGVVWHHPNGRMVKIKKKDFGLTR